MASTLRSSKEAPEPQHKRGFYGKKQKQFKCFRITPTPQGGTTNNHQRNSSRASLTLQRRKAGQGERERGKQARIHSQNARRRYQGMQTGGRPIKRRLQPPMRHARTKATGAGTVTNFIDETFFRYPTPDVLIISFEKCFKRAHYSRHPRRNADEELRKVNRGETLWCGLYRAIFLPDDYWPFPRFRQASAALQKATQPFALHMSDAQPEKREIRLSRDTADQASHQAAIERIFKTAQKLGVKL